MALNQMAWLRLRSCLANALLTTGRAELRFAVAIQGLPQCFQQGFDDIIHFL
jgi:hypothetical protein